MRFVNFARTLGPRLIALVSNDYVQAQGLLGYLKRRVLEKGTWLAISSAVVAANELKQPYAGLSIVVAAIMALLPTP